jgi:hypothetical protein
LPVNACNGSARELNFSEIPHEPWVKESIG